MVRVDYLFEHILLVHSLRTYRSLAHGYTAYMLCGATPR